MLIGAFFARREYDFGVIKVSGVRGRVCMCDSVCVCAGVCVCACASQTQH